jgi:hypothetical protein
MKASGSDGEEELELKEEYDFSGGIRGRFYRPKMKIEHYSFGKIIVDGKTYTSDVIIYPDRVDSSWWRKEGHTLHIEDLHDVLNANPAVVVVGTGFFGIMKVPKETIAYLESKGIEVHAARTGKAVEIFNTFQAGKKVIAAFHLTC